MNASISVQSFFDPLTHTFTHLVVELATKKAVVIDPVLEFDPVTGRISSLSADALIKIIQQHSFSLQWILETHAHADHLSAGDYLRQKLSAPIAIGRGILSVQKYFASRFNIIDIVMPEGGDFDRLLEHNERVVFGSQNIQVIATPGHTSDSVSYLIGSALFIGDTFFAPDTGTARCDFPGGDANALWQSMQLILSLPDTTRVFVCHDYPPTERAPKAEYLLSEMRDNVHLRDRKQTEYLQFRQQRDASLAPPRLLLPALQINIRAGKLPPRESNGECYLKLPISLF